MSIFGQHAARYFAKGLSVTPLITNGKKPFLDGWQKYHDHLPSAEMQEAWIKNYPHNNMGLVLGRQSNITVIDVDTEDEKIAEAIYSVLPKSKWIRIGAKGAVLAYKYTGIPTFRINNAAGQRVVEYLSTRTQVVLPPSIHPDTMKPYWADNDLVDVCDDLTELPDNIEEILRAILATVTPMENARKAKRLRLSDKVASGARDTQMNRMAGFHATCIQRGETTLMQAISDMRAWADLKVERKKGDEIDVEKGCQQIIQYLVADINNKGRMLPPGWDDGLSEENKKNWGLDFSEDQEEWTCQQHLDNLHRIFETYAPDDPNRHKNIDTVVSKLAKSQKLNSIEMQRILEKLKANTGMAVGVYKKEIAELQKGDLAGQDHTEIANAALRYLEDKRGYTVRRYNQEFWSWEGTHWSPMDDNEIWKIIAQEYGHLPAARRANDHKGIISVMATLVPQKLGVLEIEGINFRNGFLTTDLVLVPHNPDFGMTYMLDMSYDPDLAGKAHLWEDLMFKSWGHNGDYEDKKKAIQEAIAVTLFGKGTSYQRGVLLYGVAGSGKSQMLEVVQHMVPVAAKCSVTPDQWDDKFSISFLDKKLLNIVGELHEKKPMPGKQFKELIDGTEQTGQHKFKPLFQFVPKACHWFASNFLPKTRDTSNGFNRRWLILNFDLPVAEKDRIPDLGKTIAEEELDAIVAWAIQSYPALRKRGCFTLPTSHHFFANEMGEQNSMVRQWFNSNVIETTNAQQDAHALFIDFFTYCTKHGASSIVREKHFHIELEQLLAEVRLKDHVLVENNKIYTRITIKGKKNGQ